MASVYRRHVLSSVPVGAVVCGNHPNRNATWTDHTGRIRRAKVSSSYDRKLKAPVDKIVIGESKMYEIAYTDPHGRRHTCKGYADKKASIALGEKLQRRAARLAEGLEDPIEDEMKRPIREHLAAFIQRIKRRGRSEDYVKQLETRILRIIDSTGSRRLHELDPVKIGKFVDGLHVGNERADCRQLP